MNSNVLSCYVLLESLKVFGVTHCVLSPGSRSTPLAYVANEVLDTIVVIDERDAGFVALGVAESSNKPVVIITTSGSAPTHLHPAVVEAFHSNVPLIVISADRPHEIRGIGAPQTIDQTELFGTSVRHFCDAKNPLETDEKYWAEIALTLFEKSTGTDNLAGPVHLNLGMSEPLVPDGDELEHFKNLNRIKQFIHDQRQIQGPEVSDANTDDRLVNTIDGAKRLIVTIGRNHKIDSDVLEKLHEKTNCVVLVDVTSNFRDQEKVISNYDAILRHNDSTEYLPDVVVQIGEPLTSKLWNQKTQNIKVIAITSKYDDTDPYRAISFKSDVNALSANIDKLSGPIGSKDESFSQLWNQANEKVYSIAKDLARKYPDKEPSLFIQIGQTLESLEAKYSCLLASSMPIRYGEWFWNSTSKSATIYSHRGTNGIDGMLSSALGIAYQSHAPVICVIGDVAFAHDVGFLTHCAALSNQHGLCVVFLIVDNAGGAIFRHLDQANNNAMRESYREIMQTPPGLDVEKMSIAAGAKYTNLKANEASVKISQIINSCESGTHAIHVGLEHESGPEFMKKYRELIQNY